MRTTKTTFPLILGLTVFLSAFTAFAQSQEVFDLLRKRHVAAAKALIEKDPALIEARDNDGNTLLHYAPYGGDVGLINFLIDKGAKTEAVGPRGLTPLHVAAMNNRSQRDGESHAYWVRADVIEKLRPAAQAPRDESRLAEPREKRFNDIQPPFSGMRY